jgi:hypothetical protein
MRRTFVNKFNRGEIDPKAMMRIDVDKIASTGSTVTNWMPMRLGPMTYLPGFEYLGSVPGVAYFLPFIAATDDVAQLEFTDELMRVWVDDAPITRPTVTTAVTNSLFTSNITGWTDDSGGTGTSAWASLSGLGALSLVGDGALNGAAYQTISTVETGTEHALRINVIGAPVELRIGTTVGGSEIFGGKLSPGTHSLSLTPAGDFTIYFANRNRYAAYVNYAYIEPAGILTLDTPIAEASLPLIRSDQSADVVYLAAGGVKLIEVQRRGIRSWSVVDFRSDDGPFGTINTSGISLSASALSGNVNVSSSDAFFQASQVGALFKLSSSGQIRQSSVSAENTGTGSIRVTGVGDARRFTISIYGTWSATVTLQQSTDDSTWSDVQSYTGNQAKVYDDTFDNAILYYRLFVKTGNYTSGTAFLGLNYASGSIDGVIRVTGFTNDQTVTAQVISELGGVDPTLDWYEGEWSSLKGYPSAVRLFEGRLWWGGKDSVWGSVSDAFRSYDDLLEGNSASIRKTIGFGPSDSVNWLFSTNQLIMGLASDEIVVRSTSFGEAMTPLNTNLRRGTSQGSAPITPIQSDSTLYFVQRSLQRIFEFGYSNTTESSSAYDTTTLNPSICEPGIKRIAVARQPETRIFAVLNDGTARVYLVDASEEVRGWSRIELDGTIEDIVIMPALSDDRVYILVSRSTGRAWEKMALFSEAQGGSRSKHFDSSVSYTSPGLTLSGLTHLEASSVGVWADGQDRGSFTVASGSINLPTSWTNVEVGLRHTAVYRSNKLNEFIGKEGYITANQNKRVISLAMVAENFYPATFQYGSDENNLQYLPLIEDGTTFDHNATLAEYDKLPFYIDSTYDTDSRVYLKATGPATILSMVYEIDDPDYTSGKSE